MSESIGDLLIKRNDREPREFSIIRKFVKDRFNSSVSLAKRRNQIIISAPNAALIGSLRLVLHELEEECSSNMQLVLRIN